MLTSKSLLFVKFSFNPDIEQKTNNITKLLNLRSSPNKKKIVSSVNCKCNASTISLPILNPSITPYSIAFSTNLPKQSITIVNKKRKEWITLSQYLVAPNFPPRCPFTKIEKLTEDK
ncbi:hypothetical protein LguiB_031346 [Lonicera macranthoides]